MGGPSSTFGFTIALGSDGSVYTAGQYSGTTNDFDPGPNTYTLPIVSGKDAYISKLDSNGNFIWTKSFIGPSDEIPEKLTLDQNDNLYIAGYFEETIDFDPSPNNFTLTAEGDKDIFITKLDKTGNFIWVKQIGGLYTDWARSITSDNDDYIYATGTYNGNVDFDPGPSIFMINGNSSDNILVLKLDTIGNFVWAKGIGKLYTDRASSINLDYENNIIVAGYFDGIVDFNPNAGLNNLQSNGLKDIFVLKLDNDGNFLWAKQTGGISSDETRSVTTDKLGNIYITGWFSQTVDFDPGIGFFELSVINNNDGFISKLDKNGDFLWAKQLGDSGSISSFSIETDTFGNIFSSGRFNGSFDADPNNGVSNLTATSGEVYTSTQCLNVAQIILVLI